MGKKALVKNNRKGIERYSASSLLPSLAAARQNLFLMGDAFVKDGWRLIVALLGKGFRLKAAFWLLGTEEEAGPKLVLASPYTDEHGPLKSYSLIADVLAGDKTITSLSLEDIRVIETREIKSESLNALIPTDSKTSIPDPASYHVSVTSAALIYHLPVENH